MTPTQTPKRISLLPSSQAHSKERSPYAGVPATDQDGHSNSVGAKVATYIKRQIDVLMRTGTDRGWQCESDFIRWCYRLGLEQIAAEQRDGEQHFSEIHKMNASIMEIIRTEEEYSEFDQTIGRMEKLVQRLTAQGQIDRVKKVIHKVYHDAFALQDVEWKKYYAKRLEESFGVHMKRLKISLKPSDQVSDEIENAYERGTR